MPKERRGRRGKFTLLSSSVASLGLKLQEAAAEEKAEGWGRARGGEFAQIPEAETRREEERERERGGVTINSNGLYSFIDDDPCDCVCVAEERSGEDRKGLAMPECAEMESVVDQTLVAALPDCGARGAAAAMTVKGGARKEEVEAALAADTWRQKEAKALARVAGGGAAALSEGRRWLWRGVYLRRVGGDGDAAATARLYWETVKTCFGDARELPPDSPASLPSLLDPNHTASYCLKATGRQSVIRVATCIAYNRPGRGFFRRVLSLPPPLYTRL